MRTLANQAKFLIAIVAILWGIEVVDFLIRAFSTNSLDRLGIRPRRLEGLLGIPCAPFLHGGFKHLAGNTVPLLVLSSMALVAGSMSHYLRAVGIIILCGGLGTWLFGQSNSLHVGASGVVFGLAGYVFTRGVVTRKPLTIALSIAVAIFYGGLAASLLRFTVGISWTGHAFGLVAGVLAATTSSKITAKMS